MDYVNTAEDLGTIIRRERKRQDLTQDDLARYSGVGVNFISQVERGKQTAEVGKVLQLLQALGIVLAAGKRSTWRSVSGYIESVEQSQHS